MQNLSFHPTAAKSPPPDPAREAARLEELLAERRRELAALQEEMHAFKARYTQVVGSRLAELAEIEQAIREAESRLLGLDPASAEEAEEPTVDFHNGGSDASHASGKVSLRKLFWSVARMFHPDHAADEQEARRRHTIMAEASRAYSEGDVDSLHVLLGDEELQSYCAVPTSPEETEDIAERLLRLKEELRTVEFGIKRVRQDGLYTLKLRVEDEAREGRDVLAQMAERIRRQITKARHRLEHLS
jgi:hypothetical protein